MKGDRLSVYLVVASYMVGFFLGAFSVMQSTSDGPRCFEDSVLVWNGDGHNLCVALDDFGDTESIERLDSIVAER